jgi:tetratricopeptide (TPR) repeat protein
MNGYFAQSLVKAKKYEDALIHFKKMRDLYPENTSFGYANSLALAKLGRCEEAKKHQIRMKSQVGDQWNQHGLEMVLYFEN